MRVIHLAGATTFHDPETGATYAAGPDGVFDMPEHVGTHYTTKHAGMFRRESDHEKLIAAAKAETLRDPGNTPGTLQALLERVSTLEAKVAQWEEWFGAPPAATPEAPAPPVAEEPAPSEPDAEAEAPGKSEEEPEAETDGEDEPEPEADAPLRKPTPRKTPAKRHS